MNDVLKMSNTTYDRLRFFALVFLPAVGTLYFALGQIWGFPAIEEVLGSVVSIEIFLGTLLGISNAKHKEELRQRPESKLFVDEEGDTYADFEVNPNEVGDGETITLRVIRT